MNLKKKLKRALQKNSGGILIRGANWIGDAVMTTPTVRAIRKNFPGVRISMLAKPWVAPVFENSPYVDAIFLYDAKDRHHGVTGLFRLARELRKEKFGLAFLMQNAFEAALISFLAGMEKRIGFNRDGRGFLLTHPIPCTGTVRTFHQVFYYLEILRRMGLETDGPGLDLFLTSRERQTAAAGLIEGGSNNGNLVIGFNPGATFGTAKRWPPGRWVSLGKHLKKRYDAFIVLFGGPGDEVLGEEIRSRIGDRCLNLAGKTTLREAFALIEACHFFVSNDSGLMHVAAALDVPMTAIFGSTDHVATAPMGKESTIVRMPVDCAPCLKPDCPTDHRCMEGITVEHVFSSMEPRLDALSESPSSKKLKKVE